MEKTYIITRAFQYKGTMWRPGHTLKLSREEAAVAFVAAHVKAVDAERDIPGAANYLGNGKIVKKDAPAGKADDADADGMSVKEMRETLAKMGVPCPPKATKEDLRLLYAQMVEATAGNGMAGNVPKESGV